MPFSGKQKCGIMRLAQRRRAENKKDRQEEKAMSVIERIKNQAKTNVNSALNKITGATQISTGYYWSSSQYGSNSNFAWRVDFESGILTNGGKYNTNSVCAVRAFND